MKKSQNQSGGKTKSKKSVESLTPINPDAAGIGIGADSHWVSVPSDRAEQNVREFSCYTPDLYALAKWLEECQIKTVVMESTGVYWIPLFQILETRKFEVLLVNSHHLKTLPGRKSDVLDYQWLQQLHSYGLLAGSFRPSDEICVLRSDIRHRDSLIRSAGTHVVNRAANAFRLAAHAVGKTQTALGGFYRRLRSRLSAPKAVTATAHKLARIFYCLWTKGGEYEDPGVDFYEQKYQQRLLKNLQKKAEQIDFELVPQSSTSSFVS